MRTARLTGLLAIALVVGLTAPVGAQEIHELRDMLPPHPEPAFLHGAIPAAPCTVDDPYEATIYDLEEGTDRYGDACKRLKFSFGPIVVKPGENDALLEPVTIEKPAYAGKVVRFKPDLVLATGGHPATEDMHLHHATWLSGYPTYGNGLPFFAAGEEKTVATFPEGYGLPVNPQDVWLLLYMVHNDQYDTQVVWLTYEIDFVAESAADALEIVDIKPIWLDVQRTAIHPGAPSTSSNPVFNVQRGFGSPDPETGRLVCTWPRENCARHDTYGGVTPQQGVPIDGIRGADWRVGAGFEGTIIGLGGHLHFGGIRDEVSLVRQGEEKPIFISDALYWDPDEREHPAKVGASPHSWDFSMTVTGAPDWKVKIREGDIIRLNTVTDSEDASWYEGMGIVVAYVAPDDPHGVEGVDVFDDEVIIERGYPARLPVPEGPWDVKNNWRPDPCEPNLAGDLDGVKTLCLRGAPTHGPLEESSNHSGGCEGDDCPALVYEDGDIVDEIRSVGFSYGEADHGLIGVLGIPLLKVGEPVRFWNYDTVARVWHTFTRCAYPCTGNKDMKYPAADGGGLPDDPMANVMDFDSNEIGYGTPFEPAAGQLPNSHPQKDYQRTIRDGLYWEFEPTEPGVYTFFCRIHKGMRGAFKVVE